MKLSKTQLELLRAVEKGGVYTKYVWKGRKLMDHVYDSGVKHARYETLEILSRKGLARPNYMGFWHPTDAGRQYLNDLNKQKENEQ